MAAFEWLTQTTKDFLVSDYLLPGQSAEDRLIAICNAAERRLGLPGYGQRLWDNLSRGWYSLSTPLWTNFGTERGLPISCFGSYIEDSMESILHTLSEVGMMTKMGGGTAIYPSPLRPRGSLIKDNGESHGPVHFLPMFDSLIETVSQGKTRRGNCAVYMDIDHPDTEEFLSIRSDGSRIQTLFPGLCIPDRWLEEMVAGDKEKRRLWAKVLESRASRGVPYLIFTDNVNRQAPDVYRDKGMRIYHSQLCTEIFLPTSPDESFVCDLSSMNILKYDEWSGTDAVEVLTFLLDAVMSEFIERASKYPDLARAVKFARRHRALGIGQVGWHSYLQSRMVPFETTEAKLLNIQVARSIRDASYEASAKLASIYGEPELLEGYGRRNTTLMAIAPTKSSAFILGQVSESIEPETACYFIKDRAKGKYTYKNPHLSNLLTAYGLNTQETWASILAHGGSVQHLDFLNAKEKAVFKTASEISQREVIIQAAARQKYIDQGQSLNLTISPHTPARDVNALVLEAWRMGIKSLYYQYSVNAAQAFCRDILSCSSCEA